MLLECTCGKMSGSGTAPARPHEMPVLRRNPPAGRGLRSRGPGVRRPLPPPIPAALKELESKIAELEKSAGTARAATELKGRELEEMAGRLAQAQKGREEAGQEAGRAKAEAQKKESEGKDRSRASRPSRRSFRKPHQGQQAGLTAIKEKDAELHYAQERHRRLERELQGSQAGPRRGPRSGRGPRPRLRPRKGLRGREGARRRHGGGRAPREGGRA